MAGIFVAECVHRRYKCMEKVHWRQLIILAEIVLLFFVGFLPQESTPCKRARLVRLRDAGAVLPQGGRYSYASTMCIGNLRSGTAALSVYFRERKSRQLEQQCITLESSLCLHWVPALEETCLYVMEPE